MKKTLGLLIVCLMTISLIGCGSGGSSPAPDDAVDPLLQGLQAYYPFDGNAADSIGDNDGTVSGATPTTDHNGNAGRAYSLDGVDDKITIPRHMAQWGNGKNAISVSFWIKFTAANSYAPIDASGFAFYQNVYVGDDSNFPGIAFVVYSADAGNNAEYSNDDFSYGEWKHIVGTFDGAKIRLYIDGVFISDRDFVDTITDRYPAKAMVIGTENDSQFWPGCIDDLRVYDRALSPAEITSLYEL